MGFVTEALLRLGTFSFQGLEVPSRIVVRGKQRILVRYFGLGSLALDSLGSDCETVSFAGVFSGKHAPARSRSVEYLRQQGSPLLLVWGSTALSVLISELVTEYSSEYWIPYRIICLVSDPSYAPDVTSPDYPFPSPVMQINEIQALLKMTSLALSPEQRKALLAMADQRYGIATRDTVALAESAVAAMDNGIETTTGPTQSEPDDGLRSLEYAARDVKEVTDFCANQAALTLSRNRIMSMIIAARQNLQQ